MKFILYKNAKHLRVEGIGESIRRRLSEFVARNRRSFGYGATTFALAASGLATTLGLNATPARAAEISDTTTPIANEQVVNYDEMQAESDAAIAEAVENAQNPTPVQEETNVVSETPTQNIEITQEQTGPAINEEINNRVPEVDTETTPEVTTPETAPVQEETNN